MSPEARQTLAGWVGRDLATQELRDMVGAPSGARVWVEPSAFTAGAVDFYLLGAPVPVERYVPGADISERMHMELGMIQMPVFGGDSVGRASRTLARGADGRLEMHNDVFRVLPEYQGRGIGVRVFAKEVKTLAGLRDAQGQQLVSRIGALMAGHRRSSDQGYYVWPLMGYNTRPGALRYYYREMVRDKSVSSGERARVRKLGANLTVQDLYQSAEGRAWWRQHGIAEAGTFDLTPGSRSLQILHAYLTQKGIAWDTL